MNSSNKLMSRFPISFKSHIGNNDFQLSVLRAFVLAVISFLLCDLFSIGKHVFKFQSFGVFYETIFVFLYEIIINSFVIFLIIRIIQKEKGHNFVLFLPIKIKFRNFLFAFCLAIGFYITYRYLMGDFIDKIPISKFFDKFISELEIEFERNPYLLILSAVFVGPFFEEILFRGIILKGLISNYNTIIGILVSSAIFAFSHIIFPQVINAFIIGLFLSFIYIRFNSLLLNILIHLFFNILAILLALKEFKFDLFYFVIGIILLVFGFYYSFFRTKK